MLRWQLLNEYLKCTVGFISVENLLLFAKIFINKGSWYINHSNDDQMLDVQPHRMACGMLNKKGGQCTGGYADTNFLDGKNVILLNPNAKF